jgi:uncharacterized protein (DUF885 family)
MNMRYRRAALAAMAALAVVIAPSAPARDRALEDFFRDFTADWVRGNPNLATATRYFSGPEQDELERQLTPETAAWRHGRVELARRGLAELRKFDRARMSETQRVSADLMQWQLGGIVEGEAYEDYRFPLDQFGGANVNLVNTLTVVHPLRGEKDAANYVARLGQVRARMEEAVSEARRLAAKGMIPPRFILRATIAQMQQFVATPAAENPFVTVLAERMAAVKSIPNDTQNASRSDAERLVAAEVYPAWRAAIALLESLVARSTDDAGLWRLQGGSQAYAYSLQRFTTTSLSADQIHEIGLREVDRLEKQMDAVLRRIGRSQGPLANRIARLSADLEYPGTGQARRAIMADIERFLRDAESRAASLFDRRPRAPVVAQPYPRFREAAAAASYTSPAPDGSRPGIFQIPLRPGRMTKYGLRTLVYHETVPGHHFQIALEMENDAQPRFRRIRALGGISAFGEGWALYAERLAAESGWYDDDPEGLLGQLDGELFRARRLVVDTGIHAKRWTRQQAIDYGIEASEVERYVVIPGQACAYMLGELKLLELRDKARKALGRRFSLKEFHNAVLGTGTVPLDVLEQQVDAYIKEKS